jgi:hypothetical protein
MLKFKKRVKFIHFHPYSCRTGSHSVHLQDRKIIRAPILFLSNTIVYWLVAMAILIVVIVKDHCLRDFELNGLEMKVPRWTQGV